MDMWQAKHGFEAAWVMCGNVPNEDGSLAAAHETVNAKDVCPLYTKVNNGLIHTQVFPCTLPHPDGRAAGTPKGTRLVSVV